MKYCGLIIAGVLFSIGLMAMEEAYFEPYEMTLERAEWGAKEPKWSELESQKKVTRFIIGHTVTKLGSPILTLQAIQDDHIEKWANIAYTACLDPDGRRYK